MTVSLTTFLINIKSPESKYFQINRILIMKLQCYIFLLAMTWMSSDLFAQHRDLEFGYDDTANPSEFLLSPETFSATTADGIDVVSSEMDELDPFNPGEFSADQPGFATNGAEGLIVNSGDSILVNVLDASVDSNFGVGYVSFYNPGTDALEATGRIAFLDNTASTTDLVLNGGSIESGDSPQFIGAADSDGDIHDHITWDLLDDDTAPNGAYGLLVQIQSDFAPFDGTVDVSSEPFWIVFNHGMSEADFENLALPRFGVGVAAAEPQVASIELNGGENQRSAVETLSILFDSEVTIANGAFSVVQRSTATEETFDVVTINTSEQVVNNQTSVTIQFDSHTRNPDNALVDGNYQVTVDASLVTNNGTPMAADFVFGDVEADGFFAFYGDSDGNRTVNVLDLLTFRQSFRASTGDTAYAFFMDFDANGTVNVLDLLPFRSRFRTSIPFAFGSFGKGGLQAPAKVTSSVTKLESKR